MSTTILIQAGMGLALAGFFAACYLRFSRPAQAMGGRDRVTPTV